MDLGLNGKKALILGASTGLGFAIAEGLKNEGADIAICSSNRERLDAASKKLGGCFTCQKDLRKLGSGRELVNEVSTGWGAPDILVTNAGGPPKGKFLEQSQENWIEAFQSLWMSAVESIQTALPSMQNKKWGRIILVTSVAAKEPMPGLTLSNGLRAGLSGLTKSISNEVAQFGVTINAVLPGFTNTERLKELGIPKEKINAQVPAGRMGEPNELADLACFLASERASYICGQVISCDGGYLKGI